MFKWILLFAMLGLGCTASFIKHNQHIAAQEADRFLQAFLVEQNLDKSWLLGLPEGGQTVTVSELSELLNKLHPAGDFPTSVKSVEYELMPGQPAIRIFATGAGPGKDFYYIIVMQGSEPTGYRPSEIYRSERPFAESSMRKPLL